MLLLNHDWIKVNPCQQWSMVNPCRQWSITKIFTKYFSWISIVLWWWFCPWCVVGAIWFYTAWLFLLMPVPTESIFCCYFLSDDNIKKCRIWKKFHATLYNGCNYLSMLGLMLNFVSKRGPRSPWSPSWFLAGNDERCMGANEYGRNG